MLLWRSRLWRDATGHHGLAATRRLHDQFRLVIRRRRLLREVQNPDLRRCRGGGRSGASRDATSDGGVPTAVRACPGGRRADALCHGAQQRILVCGPVDTADMTSHSQMRSSVCIACMCSTPPTSSLVATDADSRWVGRMLIYYTVVMFSYIKGQGPFSFILVDVWFHGFPQC
jgi:hypothetical protein